MADITRADVAGLIQDAYSSDFLSAAARESAVLKVFPTVDMGTKVHTMPVLATVPHAKWVGETLGTDTAKPTSDAGWQNKQMVAEEVAVIIPVPEATIDDATADILGSLAVLGGNAMGAALDAAVCFGINKPASWTSADLFASATAAGNLAQVSATPGESDLAGSFYKAAELLDDDGMDPSAVVTRKALSYRLANLRATDGTPILQQFPADLDRIIGLPTGYVTGTVFGDVPAWDRTKAEAMVVDRSRVRIGIRQDIQVKFLDQATVGGINLAENDMVALRFKARYAYVLNDVKADKNASATSVSPVAAVTPATEG